MAIDDEMENAWGTELVPMVTKPARKSNADLDQKIRTDVRGWKLQSILTAGTNANQDALLMASGGDPSRCLTALGSYVGGNGFTQPMSTSMYDTTNRLSVPKFPENASPECLASTVALPHTCGPCENFTREEMLEHEAKCLRHLHKILIMAALEGRPYRVLLLEYILGGNGGELSGRFLIKLARLLKVFDVVVVADEILTGGRVGPGMVMTTSVPEEFQERVEYITMGKFMHCALILKKIPTKPTHQDEMLRGTSTTQDAGEAYSLWVSVSALLKKGAIKRRQKQVLQKLKLTKHTDEVWGRGLLLFISKSRMSLYKGLKNRVLPMLMTNIPVRALSCRPSKWNRSTVTEYLRSGAIEWMDAQVSTCSV